MKLEDYQDKATWLIRDNQKRNNMLAWMDNAYKGEWAWPQGNKPDWVHKTISSDPHDALRSGTQIFSSVAPKPKIVPLNDNEETRAYYNNLEKALRFLYYNASRRSSTPITQDIVQSAMQYGMTAAQVMKVKGKSKELDARLRNAQRFGPFAVIVRKPSNIYPVFSEYMLEEVLFTRAYKANEFKLFWGEEAYKKVAAKNKNKDDCKYVLVYEFADHENQIVWASTSEKDSMHEKADGIEIKNEPHGFDGIPWIVKTRGPSFYNCPEDKLEPLLYSVYKSGHWDTQNLVLTLLTSEVISYAASPRMKVQSYNPEAVEIDYGEPGNKITSPDPDAKIEALQPPQIDRAMGEILEILSSMIGKETVARMIQNPEMKADVPFSSMNLIYQLGANSLNPYKELAQDTIAEIMYHMLLWIKRDGKTVETFDMDKGSKGKSIIIDPTLIDFNNFYLDVELTADVPTDRLQRINAASIANQNLHLPLNRALEQIGVPDPETAITEYEQEQRQFNDLQVELQRKQGMLQIQLQNMAGMAQMAQQGMMQQAQGIGGQGFNPEMGGTPPAQANPAETRETASGQTKAGDNLAGVM